jgi:1-aminocyclopropane-1-carboxylate deaminase/D-cysteine desulfhydrase-like pyridoxal-dependent ACC family enzyme
VIRDGLDRGMLGTYPTPVVRLTKVERACGLAEGVELWCKRDDWTSATVGGYGGNKVRKLEHLLEEAKSRGAKRLVTVGAVGSHHVLATALYGARQGFEVEAVLTPQPATVHVEEVARIDASLGLRAYPVKRFAAVPFAVTRRLRDRTAKQAYFIPPGGSSVTGSLGYVDAARELSKQIAKKELPRPTKIVAALGSGGTVAGLLVGLHHEGLLAAEKDAPGIELVAVQVVEPPLTSGPATLALALAIERRLGTKIVARGVIATLSRALRVTRAYLGKGYGHSVVAGDAATTYARADALTLDPTYTAKAFAGALDEARRAQSGEVILYWHTLAAPDGFAHLLASAPPLSALDPKIRALLRPIDP